MRSLRALPLLVVAGLAGCALPEPAPPPRELADYAVTSLAISVACAHRREAFDILVTIANHEDANGTARLRIGAQQYGFIVNEDVPLSARETRNVTYARDIGHAGRWEIYAQAPSVTADAVMLRVVEAHEAC